MPWNTPPLSDVRSLARDYITSRLNAGAMVPNSVLRILSDFNAGLAHLTLLYVDWLAKQLLVDTAESEWLDRHADIWVGGRKAPTFASGQIAVVGSSGITIPQGTQFQGQISGAEVAFFETTGPVILGDTATLIPVQAITAGTVGNLDAGAALTILSAISGVDGVATVKVLHGGTDEENDDDLRARVLKRIRQPPMGGDKTDYEEWALSRPGVTRAWSSPLEMGMGTVTLRFMMDDLRDYNHGIPEQQDVDAVAAYLDTVRPVAVKDFFCLAPIPQRLILRISNLSSDDAATRAAITASLQRMLMDRALPGQTIYRSWVNEAVSEAVGENHHELTFTTTPMASAGHIATLDSVIYA